MVVAAALLAVETAQGDSFGTGDYQFTIDFVLISGSSNPSSGISTGNGFTFTGISNDYRMGIYEITNSQWNKFKAAHGAPTGNPSDAYDRDSSWTGNMPVDCVSWYEAAQFVNWLNTSTGHQAAYKFTGTLGTSDYTFTTWSAAEAAGGNNLYRHKDAFYYLPSEGEWVKAAYWNGTTVQLYATKPGETLTQGDGTSGTGWRYRSDQHANLTPWDVGSGSQELNGTYDMMGNVNEYMESPYHDGEYQAEAIRGYRGGAFGDYNGVLWSWQRMGSYPFYDTYSGFRVASVPEPCSMALVTFGGLLLLRRAGRAFKRGH